MVKVGFYTGRLINNEYVLTADSTEKTINFLLNNQGLNTMTNYLKP